jgi:phage terminase large subunit-like protein/ribosomal protein L32
MEGVVFTALREWCPRSQLVGDSWDSAYNKQLRRLDFKNGSFFEFMTYEQALDKFGGAARHRIHYDEEPPQAIRNECKARLIDYGGDEIFTMTPLNGMTWMFDEVYERRHEDGITVVTVATDENPHLDTEARDEFFANLTEEEAQARREGRFVHFGGLVLGAWDDDFNLADELKPGVDELGRATMPDQLKGQTIMVGIDPGVVRGGVVWAAFDRTTRCSSSTSCTRRTSRSRRSPRRSTSKNAYWRIKPQLYVIDPSARNRSLTNAVTVQTEFMQGRIPTIPGQNDREAGVLQLRRRMTARPAALTVTRNCVNWLFEKGRWRIVEDEETSQNKNSSDTFATQGPDHLMDPTRYLAMQRVFGPVLPNHLKRRAAYQHGHEPAWTPNPRIGVEQGGPMGAYA